VNSIFKRDEWNCAFMRSIYESLQKNFATNLKIKLLLIISIACHIYILEWYLYYILSF